MTDYPDTNNNGIPDAFENRRSITEILNAEPRLLSYDNSSLVIEIEQELRAPKGGEMFLAPVGPTRVIGICKTIHGLNNPDCIIVKRIIAGLPEIMER